MEVLFATGNRYKVDEVEAILGPLGIVVRSLADVELQPEEPEEDGATFEDNARLKARYYARQLGMTCVAEDSGLEVDALGGAPGVYSARYAGVGATDEANNAKLIEAMRGVPHEKRGVRYRCVAAFVDPSRDTEVWRSGSCEGQLTEEPRGTGGFGYDPYFLVPPRGLTMAEIPISEKNVLSHRAAAFRALAVALASPASRS